MIWMLLLVGLTSSVCGAFVEKRTFYQAEEDDDITIGWDSRTKTDMSSTNLVCFLQSEPLKRLYELVNSVEVPESQHQQFAGRVQCDKDALREGRIRLHLSRVTTDDSGHYRCDLAANYDKIMRRWVLETTEHFVLNVTSHGENSDVLLNTPKLTEGAKPTPGGPKSKEVRPNDWNNVTTTLEVASDQNQDRSSLIELLRLMPRGSSSSDQVRSTSKTTPDVKGHLAQYSLLKIHYSILLNTRRYRIIV
ncbi:uncharacterized protein LOC122870232 isoform X9 [Siniperca chuatsi]|uniref:uncharacterized protein LOC122870232 isoform X9 n=1 Tax=Siniperca chuatsi TaxID=119488 RepID=UPI001CE16F4D|nr:uncharacterized protein LOC122870232 isoform X9 [Siniperca chuatsi]XP_044040215.1 uncharacterized protein LOC122870232 isoform X9 [Siniperca chuatsi]